MVPWLNIAVGFMATLIVFRTNWKHVLFLLWISYMVISFGAKVEPETQSSSSRRQASFNHILSGRRGASAVHPGAWCRSNKMLALGNFQQPKTVDVQICTNLNLIRSDNILSSVFGVVPEQWWCAVAIWILQASLNQRFRLLMKLQLIILRSFQPTPRSLTRSNR